MFGGEIYRGHRQTVPGDDYVPKPKPASRADIERVLADLWAGQYNGPPFELRPPSDPPPGEPS